MTLVTASPARLRAAWGAAHEPVPGVPRWARIAALAIPFTVLPSGLWRIAAFTLHLPIIDPPASGSEDMRGDVPAWLPMELYVVLLSIVSEAFAFLGIGLIAGWGEVFPHWIPGLRGRRVPTAAAVVPAAVGAAILTVMWTWTVVTSLVLHETIQGDPERDDFPIGFQDWKGVLGVVAYVPLVAWGPLLAAVTVAYYRRRAQARRRPPSQTTPTWR
ncbi:hypothetical protein [Actinomadura decatromicini]|uniref:Uncharacterized protein n=1 Tax=Actinomadura decatromicini TaxID=2604572 RepID=A0A5D3FW97_9ACTN|nr:hypothetical protein [Actinomadura decatromicini]TYK52308.1 hypothetical protein FXF68_00435 [Actinomadura decatromicini]